MSEQNQARPLGSQGQQLQQDVAPGYELVVTLGGAIVPVSLTQITPILKGSVFNTAVLAATNFFGADLVPTNSPTTFRMYITLNTAGVVSVRRTQGGVPVDENLNKGYAIEANAAYMFDFLVLNTQTINIRTSVGATILSCIVVEVAGVIG